MANAEKLSPIERDFASQDRQWSGPKFVVAGFFTLLFAVGLIILAATRTGCTLAIVP